MKHISTAPDHRIYSKPQILNFLKGLTYSVNLTPAEAELAQKAQTFDNPGPAWEELATAHRARMAALGN